MRTYLGPYVTFRAAEKSNLFLSRRFNQSCRVEQGARQLVVATIRAGRFFGLKRDAPDNWRLS